MAKKKLEKVKNIDGKKSQKNTGSKLSNNNRVDKNEKSLFRDSDAPMEPETSLRNEKRARDSEEAGNAHSLYDSQKNTESKPSSNSRVDKRKKSLLKDSDAPMEPETSSGNKGIRTKKIRAIDSVVAGKTCCLSESQNNAEPKPSNNNQVDKNKKSSFKDSDAPREPETILTRARYSGEAGNARQHYFHLSVNTTDNSRNRISRLRFGAAFTSNGTFSFYYQEN